MATNAKAETETETEVSNWTFDKPKTLTATVDKIRTATMPQGVNGEPFSYPLLWVTEAGTGTKYMIHAFPEVLLSELRAVRPEPGDVVTIAFLGSRKTKSGRSAKIFEVKAGDGDQPESSYDWDKPDF